MQFSYNKTYRPAFPELPIILRNGETFDRTESHSGLLDTGADGSLVPVHLLQQIYANSVGESRMRSHWGEWRTVRLFAVDIVIQESDLVLSGMIVAGDDEGDEIIFGRNVINKLLLTLNGPAKLINLPSQ